MSSSRCAAIRVVAGILRDPHGRVLVARRPAGVPHAGLWEFPGGKVEHGESDVQALARELREELGVSIGPATLFRRVLWPYPKGEVELLAYDVSAFTGEPRPLHAQSLDWSAPRELTGIEMPDADRPIAVALMLPRQYAVSPEPRDEASYLAALGRTLASGVRMVQVRAKTLDRARLVDIAAAAVALAHRSGVLALLNGERDLAAELGFDGVHLRRDQLREANRRGLPRAFLIGVSCHDASELGAAERAGADFATLSPVLTTTSHPGAEGLGWDACARLCAGTHLPVYALGGIGPSELVEALAAGAHGAAGITRFWHDGGMAATSMSLDT